MRLGNSLIADMNTMALLTIALPSPRTAQTIPKRFN